MPIARKRLLDASQPLWVHAIQRCVRRGFLCGKGREHRRQWVEDRLRELAQAFAVEVAAYAVMSNHLHVVLRLRPDAVASWDAQVVAERWCAVFGTRLARGADGRVEAATIRRFAADGAWVAERRTRLGDLSWFMRALAEPIARRANAEDDCTGRFWEGRFASVPLLDQAALVACMAYVDLNPVRARLADRPERSAHTAVRQRIQARQRHRLAQRARERGVAVPAVAAPHAADPEAGLWVVPLARCALDPGAERTSPARGVLPTDEYLTLVDTTGRALRAGKRGAIPAELAPLLARLDLDVERWLAAMAGWRSFIGRAVCAFAMRLERAQALGLRWLRNRCPLFHGEARVRPAAA